MTHWVRDFQSWEAWGLSLFRGSRKRMCLQITHWVRDIAITHWEFVVFTESSVTNVLRVKFIFMFLQVVLNNSLSSWYCDNSLSLWSLLTLQSQVSPGSSLLRCFRKCSQISFWVRDIEVTQWLRNLQPRECVEGWFYLEVLASACVSR